MSSSPTVGALSRRVLPEALPERARAWLSTVVPGARLVSATWLTGGIDHGNHAVTLVDPAGRERRFVLRRWIRPDWAQTDPDHDVARETAALALLERVGARTPRVVATDPDGTESDVPSLLMTLLEGGPPPDKPSDVDAFVSELAKAGEEIHAVDATGAGIPAFRPYHDLVERQVPSDALDPSLWLAAMEFLAVTPAPAGDTFIHRDYHPYNTLWSPQGLTAVIDWSVASIGHPDMDTGHMRWNLAVSYGLDVSERFRQAVRARTGREYDRYWDARVIVDLICGREEGWELLPDLPELGKTTPDRLRSLEQMLSRALPAG